MSKQFLIDANILVYALNKSSPYHAESKLVIDRVLNDAIKGCLTPQILFELFAVITDPRRFPSALAPNTAIPLIENNYPIGKFPLIHPKESTWLKTFELIKQHQISAQNIFDVTLVSTMLENNILSIITYDVTNFQKFSFLEITHPSSIT